MEIHHPLVSIIIPVYNAEKYLEETIQSCLNQSYKNIEIIVINDGSTDSSICIVKKFKTEKIKLFQQENKGLSAARNLGIQKSNGKFIQFLDADDLLADNKIESQYEEILLNPDSFVFCPYVREYNLFTKGDFLKEDIQKNYDSPLELILDIIMGKGNLLVHSFLLPKDIVDSVPKFNTILTKGEDGPFFIDTLLTFNKVIFSSKTIVFYRKVGADSVSGNSSENSVNSVFHSTELIEHSLLNFENSLRVKKAISILYSRHLCSFYHLKYDIFNTKVEDKIKNLGFKLIYNGNKYFLIMSMLIGVKNTLILKHFLKNKKLKR